MTHVNAVASTILIVLFVIVTVCGFAAARWRRAAAVTAINRLRLSSDCQCHARRWRRSRTAGPVPRSPWQ